MEILNLNKSKETEFNNLRIINKFYYVLGKYKNVDEIETNLGIISENEWVAKAEELINKYNETYITDSLMKYIKSNFASLLEKATEEKIRFNVLSVHISRLFEDPDWAAYEMFRDKYLKKELK